LDLTGQPSDRLEKENHIMQSAVDYSASDLLALPQTPLALEVLEFVTRNASAALSNHSIRSYLFARLVAEERGLVAARDYDPELLFCACTLHDIGLTEAGDRGQRFEVNGADVAAEILERRGVPPAQIDSVWQAIALNTSPGIVERRGLIGALTLAGVAIDFTGDAPFISDRAASQIHEVYPRLSIGRALADAVVAHAQTSPNKAPLFSVSAQLVRQRSVPPHVTELEQLASMGRWRE
jgi:hypothetical protein